ncbi:NADH-quinone oxidoreductase subunit N [Mucilaginibacter sp. UR6-11]|uniref:NADH-quinone oxidoreductase subunit N n=1 Tax=Mucilaginibacter sp. UR6-11 TaxID=1435644 RepID=UPI001E59FF97|nr:NADH-quinone oxidoreductase subunit N [Mucilaginibacter sp. UR6-11]MCC8423883.1 NADH-quinone oxidoreductase subunit N [Mucilaginibacter sp. UR6-11]
MHDLIPNIHQQLTGILGDINYFIPEIFLSLLFIVVLITDLLFGRNSERLCRIVACGGMMVIISKDVVQKLYMGDDVRFLFSGMLVQSHTGVVFKLIIDISALLLLLYFAWDEPLKSHQKKLSDLYSITIAAVFGLHLMAMAVNLLSVYLAIEMVSVASYLLVAYRSENAFSTEAGFKYVLFGAASSAVMLYGMSLLYGFTGSLSLFDPAFVTALIQVNTAGVVFAMVLVLVGMGFKLSFVPVHFWVPDVYEGAPTPITAFLSSVPKVAAFALLINFLTPFIINPQFKAVDFGLYLSVIGIVTMIAGNFAAVMQNNAKRMLAYSSIGHTGFALMAIVTFSAQGIKALAYYLAVYVIANIGALMLVTYFNRITGSDDVNSYKGLGFKYPAASICFVIILISLTGLPISAGFTGKLFVFSAVYSVYQSNHNVLLLLLTITGAVTTVVSLFYYLKIPLNLFLKRTESPAEPITQPTAILIAAIIISVVLILLGLFPDWLTRFL